MNSTPESAAEEPDPGRGSAASAAIERLHAELACPLERVAWAILRDWPLAADAVQEAFALLAGKWHQVAAEHRRGWLVKTVQLSAHNLRRRQQRASSLPERLFHSGLLTAGTASPSRAEQERLEQLREALDRLPEDQRRVVKMRLHEEQTFAEIADSLGLPLGTVLSRMRLAMVKLRQYMGS